MCAGVCSVGHATVVMVTVSSIKTLWYVLRWRQIDQSDCRTHLLEIFNTSQTIRTQCCPDLTVGTKVRGERGVANRDVSSVTTRQRSKVNRARLETLTQTTPNHITHTHSTTHPYIEPSVHCSCFLPHFTVHHAIREQCTVGTV